MRRAVPWAGALLAAAGLAAPDARAGAFTFAGEANGEDVVAHPAGYTGSGASLGVTVCIDPTSANAAAMEVPVRNAVDVWNGLAPTTGNLQAANVPFSDFDFESVALHEIGHCIGLDHPNLGVVTGLTGAERESTMSTDGADDAFDPGAGVDGTFGSDDDVRDDDGNLHYFRTADNDPFALAASVDDSNYRRDLADLPGSDLYAANCDRDVAADQSLVDTECVMQQGTPNGEAQRTLGHDDVATLRYARSGVDRAAGTSDDYSVTLSYAGQTASCDVVLDFDDAETSFAICQTSGTFIGAEHVAITGANVFFNTGTQMGNEFDWFFNPVRLGGDLPAVPHWALALIPLAVVLLAWAVLRRPGAS